MPSIPTATSCGKGKIVYASADEAQTAAAFQRVKGNASHNRPRHRRPIEGPLRSYCCKPCGGWHLTSQPVRESMAAQASA